jgi:hypothetical protein
VYTGVIHLTQKKPHDSLATGRGALEKFNVSPLNMSNVMKKVAFITTFFLLVSLACERPESLTTSLPELANQESLSIASAKNYFIKSVLPSNPSGRVAGQNKYERDIDWNSAKKVKQPNGLEVVAAPVIYKSNDRPGVIIWDDKTSEADKRPKIENVLDAKECLLTYKDKAGKFQTQIVQYIPNKEYKTKKKGVITDDFSGWVVATTWDEKLIIGYEFKNGKDIRQLTPTSGSATAGGRLSSCDFTYYQSVTANCYSCGSNCTACDVSISGGYQGFCTGPSSNSATDPNTNVSYGGISITLTGSPYDQNYVAPYSVNYGDEPAKFFVFKLKGSIVVTNPCQHAALKAYLSIIPNLEIDYNNKVWQCLQQNGLSGDALQNMFGALTISAVAKEMYNRPWSGFLTIARGILAGLTINGANAVTCVWGVQGDTNAEIDKAYNKYIEDFNKPCN